MRANQYELYCLADPLFYDVGQPDPEPSPAAADFATSRREAPAGWRRTEVDDWVAYKPVAVDLPPQGWKIHVSACSSNAEKVLDVVWDRCVARQLAFKFLRGPHWFFMRNAKQAARGYSGKLVTIYPTGVDQLELVCKELDGLLGGEPGPYVLSDLRWGDGPVFVRYGGVRGAPVPGRER